MVIDYPTLLLTETFSLIVFGLLSLLLARSGQALRPLRLLGLGLSVSHGMVRAMGGSIAAENRGEGAVFIVTLACAPDLAAA